MPVDPTAFAVDKKYVRTLTKALLHFGAPTNRIESYLRHISRNLGLDGQYTPLPGKVIVNITDPNTGKEDPRVVEADGHCSLSAIERVHEIAHGVHKGTTTREGIRQLKLLMRARPIYGRTLRCIFAFFCSACFSILEFGGSPVDMPIAGLFSALLLFVKVQFTGHEEESVEVFEIPMVFLVSFVARALSTLPDELFCYSAISSAAIVFILPGYTVLTAALELANQKIIVGGQRLVYALVYTLLLGFALTMGSDLYLSLNQEAKIMMGKVIGKIAHPRNVTGAWIDAHGRLIEGHFLLMKTPEVSEFVIEGCYRDPYWPWWRQPLAMQDLDEPLDWIIASVLALALSAFKSLAHLQRWRSPQFLGMILISFATWGTTVTVKQLFGVEPFLVSVAGGAMVGICSVLWGKVHQADIFTVSVTGVLFLVPVALSEGDSGLEASKADNGGRHPGATLAVRMLQVVWGVCVGLFIGQNIILGPLHWWRNRGAKDAHGRKKTFRHRLHF